MQLLHNFVVQRLACGGIGAQTRLGQPLVDLRIAVTTIVEVAFTVDETKDAAIRIRTTGPAGETQLIITALLAIEQRGKFGHLQIKVNACFCGHCLQNLAHLL
ncbi:hypothetical protein D3C76_1618530 [compost metagenome]